MASQPQEFPPGVNVVDGIAHIDGTLSKLPDKSFRVCLALKEISLPLSLRILGEYCLAQCSSLESLEIPSSVEVIEKAALFYCSNLEHVTFAKEQSRLRFIGDHSFAMCRSLKSIETPDSVEYIGLKAFRACHELGSVVVNGSKVKVLREKVFEECYILSHVTLPSSITHIEKGAFQSCDELQMINLSEGLQKVAPTAFEDCKKMQGNEIALRYAPRPKKRRAADKPKKNLPPIGAKIIEGCLQMNANIVELPEGALRKCSSLVELDFPNTVRIIGEFCFSQCRNLKTVKVPDQLEVIERGAFFNCAGLANLIWSVKKSCLRELGQQAFQCCSSIKKIETPESLVKIGDKAFSGCIKLEHCVIAGRPVEVLGKEAFLGSFSLKRAEIPAIIHIDHKAFHSCSALELVTVSNRLRIIGERAFQNCRSLRNFNFCEGLENIDNQAFVGCNSLEFVRVPTSLVRIGAQTFEACESLTSVVMPPKELSRLRRIGTFAFGRCSNLFNISIPAEIDVLATALNGCTILKRHGRRFGLMFGFDGFGMGQYRSDPGEDLVKSFTSRFAQLPLHQLCYHHSYYAEEELMERLKEAEEREKENSERDQSDIIGMTPLHLLALTRAKSINIWKHMLERDSEDVVPDKLGNFPLVYMLQNRIPMDCLDAYFSTLFEHDPFHPILECIVTNTVGFEEKDLRSVLRRYLRSWIHQLDHEPWRNAILREVDRICNATDQSERREIVSNLQWTLLPKLTNKEILSLLELALWKAKIFEGEGEMASSTVDTTSNEFRMESRLQCGDEVIIANVQPFLDARQDDDFENTYDDDGEYDDGQFNMFQLAMMSQW